MLHDVDELLDPYQGPRVGMDGHVRPLVVGAVGRIAFEHGQQARHGYDYAVLILTSPLRIAPIRVTP